MYLGKGSARQTTYLYVPLQARPRGINTPVVASVVADWNNVSKNPLMPGFKIAM
jgi:hypothetical protein